MSNLDQYNGKKVLVTVNQADGTATEIEGTVETANDLGILIKPKGKTKLELIEAANVAEVKLAPEALKSIAVKKLKPVELGQARAHLIDRHGYKLADINKMTEQDAFEFHASIDHKANDLGHVHVDKTATEAAGEPEESADAA